MRDRWDGWSPRTRWGVGVVVGLLVIWFMASVVLLAQARAGVQHGVDRLEQARHELTAEALLSGKGKSALDQAASDFASAHSSASSPVLAPWSVVPGVGQQTRAADALTAAAVRVTDAAERARAASAKIADTQPTTGAERIAMLQHLGEIAAVAQADLSAIDLGPTSLLASPIADARERFAERLLDLRDAVADAGALAEGAAHLLQGPRRYLVLAANNGEMRAGSGMLLSAGIATFANGEFELGDMQPAALFNPAAGQEVALPAELAQLWAWAGPSRDWRALATSPRFDVTAALAAQMWHEATGQTVDGVLVVDPVAIQGLVGAQGPIDTGSRVLDENDVLGYLLLGQYDGLAVDAEQGRRRDELSTVARAAVDALQTRPWDTSKLVGHLSEAGRGRHVLAWSRDPTEQKAWVAGGIAGTLHYDSLLVSVLNFGGNKLDQFLKVDARLTTTERGDGATDVTVNVKLRNDAPADLSGYVAGPTPGSDVGAGVYQGVVSANVPGSATDISLEGAGKVVAAGPDGPTRVLAAGYFQLPRGGELDVVLRFLLPPGVSTIEIEPSARVPAIRWHVPGRSFGDYARERVEW